MPPEDPLDDEQRAAVEATERAIIVLAGPGSGKTLVLSHRTRHLLTLDRTASALLLTFTNKAAAEMKARAIAVTPAMSKRVRAGTFHRFGMEVLRAHGTHVGIAADFDVLDEHEQDEMAQAAAVRAGCVNLMTRYSDQRLRQQLATTDVMQFANAYDRQKREAGVVDFDDLIVYTSRLFQQQPQIAQAYATKYQHILIDEFQDTNNAQFAMVRPLADHAKTISVFADDDQAIFGFAGAETRNIARFGGDLSAKEYPLTTNYRCRARIVDCANRLIAANRSAGRRMKARKTGGVVNARVFANVATEATFVCDEIRQLLSKGVQPHQISVLVRSAYRVETLRQGLVERNIPYSNWLGASYNSREQRMVRTCLAVTRPILSSQSCNALCALLGLENKESRQTAELLQENQGQPGVEQLMEVRRLSETKAKVSDVIRAVGLCLETIQPVFRLTDAMVTEVVAFEQHDPEYSLDHFLGDLALGGKGGAPTEGGGVKVATFHRTKGLQWPHVYVVGLEDGTLPDFRSQSDDAMREERRLCFVGVCRAEDALTVTRIREYKGYAKDSSPFLRELAIDDR